MFIRSTSYLHHPDKSQIERLKAKNKCLNFKKGEEEEAGQGEREKIIKKMNKLCL